MKKNKLYKSIECIVVFFPFIVAGISALISIFGAYGGSFESVKTFNFIDTFNALFKQNTSDLFNFNIFSFVGLLPFFKDIEISKSILLCVYNFVIYFVVVEIILFIPKTLYWFISLCDRLISKLSD